MIGGIAFLLVSDVNGQEWVTQYNDAEMDEVFDLGERVQLEAGEMVEKAHPGELLRYVDMVSAARVRRR